MVQLRRCFFFFENAKHLGRSDDAKQRKKKRMALRAVETTGFGNQKSKTYGVFPFPVLNKNKRKLVFTLLNVRVKASVHLGK